MEQKVNLEEVVSLAKRRGFVYPSSEIYGGLAGTYDYGPLGTSLKRNIRDEWLKFFVDGWDDMYLIDSAILMNKKVWEASGHAAGFNDPMVECMNCNSRMRPDHVKDNKCPVCGVEDKLGRPESFNMMFKTIVGPKYFSVEPKKDEILDLHEVRFKNKTDGSSGAAWKIHDEYKELSGFILYDKNSMTFLRPETAQGMFVNFKNILDSYQPDIPFGIAQVGKSFRNEISPRDWLFRLREFEIMEFEFFIHPDDSDKYFEKWRSDMHSWFKRLGLPAEKIHEVELPQEDRAHYSKRTIDFEFDFPFGRAELAGLADRGNFDLGSHEKSGTNMKYQPKDGAAPFIPHVIEPSWGLDRHVFAVLANSFSVDEQAGEKRVFLKLPVHLAPVKVAVFPLLKNKPELVEKAREVYKQLKKEVKGEVMWDDNGNIGKRYRRQDEIGTPYAITIDFQTLDDSTVTLRNRDTTDQTRVKADELLKSIA